MWMISMREAGISRFAIVISRFSGWRDNVVFWIGCNISKHSKFSISQFFFVQHCKIWMCWDFNPPLPENCSHRLVDRKGCHAQMHSTQIFHQIKINIYPVFTILDWNFIDKSKSVHRVYKCKISNNHYLQDVMALCHKASWHGGKTSLRCHTHLLNSVYFWRLEVYVLFFLLDFNQLI